MKYLEAVNKPGTVAKSGRFLPDRRFPDEVFSRAIELVLETGSAASAQRRLALEYSPCPEYQSIADWANSVEAAREAMHADRKREVIAVYADAAVKLGTRLINAADTLADTQVAVPAGIATQRYTELVRPQAGPGFALQLNFVKRGERA